LTLGLAFWSVFGPAIQYSWEHPSVEVKDAKDIRELPPYVERVESTTLADGDLAELANRSSIKNLNLGHNPNITDAGLVHVARIKGLEELNLIETSVTDKGVRSLRKVPLTYLALWHTQISDTSLGYIAEMEPMKQLQLKGCLRITDTGVAKLGKLRNLWMLNLMGCSGITNKSLKALAACPRLSLLQINDCAGISDAGIAEFKKSRPDCQLIR